MIKRLVDSLRPVWNLCALVYYEAALRQIDPMHPDVPEIVLRINELRLGRSAA